MKDKSCVYIIPSFYISLRSHPAPDVDVYRNQFLRDWGKIQTLSKPIIAAVSGYAVRSPPFYISAAF